MRDSMFAHVPREEWDTDLDFVTRCAHEVWGASAADVWMTSQNAHLGGARPVDMLVLRGRWPVLEALEANAWGGYA